MKEFAKELVIERSQHEKTVERLKRVIERQRDTIAQFIDREHALETALRNVADHESKGFPHDHPTTVADDLRGMARYGLAAPVVNSQDARRLQRIRDERALIRIAEATGTPHEAIVAAWAKFLNDWMSVTGRSYNYDELLAVVPEGKSIDEVLRMFQETKNEIYVVSDWIEIGDDEHLDIVSPDNLVVVDGYNPLWVDPVHNADGVRVCMRNGRDWISLVWVPASNMMHLSSVEPTHWRHRPTAPPAKLLSHDPAN